ncbi:hypothetical protein LINGRAHAP2_LOCUS28945 [Linum grandiflorum]
MILDRDYVCYFEVMKMATLHLHYTTVEMTHYLTPGQSMADGLHQIRDDDSAKKIVE